MDKNHLQELKKSCQKSHLKKKQVTEYKFLLFDFLPKAAAVMVAIPNFKAKLSSSICPVLNMIVLSIKPKPIMGIAAHINWRLNWSLEIFSAFGMECVFLLVLRV